MFTLRIWKPSSLSKISQNLQSWLCSGCQAWPEFFTKSEKKMLMAYCGSSAFLFWMQRSQLWPMTVESEKHVSTEMWLGPYFKRNVSLISNCIYYHTNRFCGRFSVSSLKILHYFVNFTNEQCTYNCTNDIKCKAYMSSTFCRWLSLLKRQRVHEQGPHPSKAHDDYISTDLKA